MLILLLVNPHRAKHHWGHDERNLLLFIYRCVGSCLQCEALFPELSLSCPFYSRSLWVGCFFCPCDIHWRAVLGSGLEAILLTRPSHLLWRLWTITTIFPKTTLNKTLSYEIFDKKTLSIFSFFLSHQPLSSSTLMHTEMHSGHYSWRS